VQKGKILKMVNSQRNLNLGLRTNFAFLTKAKFVDEYIHILKLLQLIFAGKHAGCNRA
jgi:hypothetical protein